MEKNRLHCKKEGRYKKHQSAWREKRIRGGGLIKGIGGKKNHQDRRQKPVRSIEKGHAMDLRRAGNRRMRVVWKSGVLSWKKKKPGRTSKWDMRRKISKIEVLEQRSKGGRNQNH